MANGDTATSLVEATAPLRLVNSDGAVIPAASKWSVAPDGDKSVPFLMSKEKMKNLQMMIDGGEEKAHVLTGGARQKVLVLAVGGHLHFPMFAGAQRGRWAKLQDGNERLSNAKRRATW